MLIKANREKGGLSKGVPNMVFYLPCMNDLHLLSDRLDKGILTVSGGMLATMSVQNLKDWFDKTGATMVSCEEPGCDVTLSDALQFHLDTEMASCYSCKTDNPVILAVKPAPTMPILSWSTLCFLAWQQCLDGKREEQKLGKSKMSPSPTAPCPMPLTSKFTQFVSKQGLGFSFG